jgi:hypothetical protein
MTAVNQVSVVEQDWDKRRVVLFGDIDKVDHGMEGGLQLGEDLETVLEVAGILVREVQIGHEELDSGVPEHPLEYLLLLGVA